MKKAIKYLETLGINADKEGNIISKLPDGERGLKIIDMLEDHTMSPDHCFTIRNNKIEKQEM